MRKIIILYCFFIAFIGFGQDKVVDLTDFDSDLLNQYLIEYTNQLRKRKRLQYLTYYPALDAAAESQAKYMADRKYLGHVQKNKSLRTVKDRVTVLGGDAEYVGENVQYISINYEIEKSKNRLTYEQLARILGENWKKSRGHYLNMIDPNYTGVSHQFAFRDGLLYACQVFSSKSFKPQFEYIEGVPFKVKDKKPCGNCKRTERKSDLDRIHYGWYQVSNDSIYYFNIKRTYFIRYEIPFFKRRISIPGTENVPGNIFKRKGKLSVDFIHLSQYDCYGNEIYDGAINYDGYYLGYIDKKRVKSEDISTSKAFIKLYIGQIPKVEDENYQIDFFLTKKDRPCSRQSLIFVSPDQFQPYEYFQLSHPQIKVGDGNFVQDSILIKVPFGRNQITDNELTFFALHDTLKALEKDSIVVTKVRFTGIASIEGTEQINQQLIDKRSAALKTIINEYFPKVPVQHQLIENFDDFRMGLSMLIGDKWLKASEEELRNYANKHKNKTKISNLLDSTRQSDVVIHYQKEYSTIQLLPSIQNLQYLIEKKEATAALLVWQQLTKKALHGDSLLSDSLLNLKVPEIEQFSQMRWEQFVLDLKINQSPVTAEKLEDLKSLGAIATAQRYLEYRLMFNLFNQQEICQISDYITIIDASKSGKEQKWLKALYLIHDYEMGHSLFLNGNEITRLVASGKFNVYQTYFVCQYLIANNDLKYAKILLENFAKQSNHFPKLYQQYLKLSYYFNHFEDNKQFKTDWRVLNNLANVNSSAFCSFFKWYHIGVRCLEKDQVANLYCEHCR